MKFCFRLTILEDLKLIVVILEDIELLTVNIEQYMEVCTNSHSCTYVDPYS